MRAWIPAGLVSAVALALVGAPVALADSSQSSNWAGYAIHRSGVNFSKVVGTWRQPSAICTAGNRTYSAIWVGLGGYSQRSQALEQIGTELDCNPSGRAVSSTWYELVPAASQTINFTVRPGDLISASVVVLGHRVTVTLHDATRHRTFVKTLHPAVVDLSSAEWIVEAPSECVGEDTCQTLPLADFGSATFDFAGATSARGHAGSISDRNWDSTRISLTPQGRHFVVYRGPGAAGGAAAPSTLSSKGTSFKVAYHTASTPGTRALATSVALPRAGRLVHPGF